MLVSPSSFWVAVSSLWGFFAVFCCGLLFSVPNLAVVGVQVWVCLCCSVVGRGVHPCPLWLDADGGPLASVGVTSSLVWPSLVMMASSESATLMGSGSASSSLSLLISLMTRSVIMSAPSCFPAFTRLRNAASSLLSYGILCESIRSMRSLTCVSGLSSPSVMCTYSPSATPMYCPALRATAVACWYWIEA